MSLHPQHAGYGHMYQHEPHRYATQYPPGPPAGYDYPPPRQPQAQPMDPHTFRQFYSQQLANLTVNSRPIIQNLSILAQEYSRMAHVVAECLETHTRLVSPQYKLTALYLLDAIAKNVNHPYASVFAEHVTRIFIDAYEAVDTTTRVKMEEMMWTWRNGAPNRRELFGVVVQRQVENFVASKHSSSRVPPPAQQQRPTPNRITKGQVLTELDVTIAQKQLLLQNRIDEATASQVDTLKQLHIVVRSSDLSQDELGAILVQLRSMAKTSTPIPPVQHDPRMNGFTPAPAPSLPSAQQPTAPVAPISADLRAFLNSLPQASQPVQPVLPPPTAPTDLSSVLNSLMKNGVPSLPPDALDKLKALQSVQIESSALKNYEKAILSMRLKPTSADITKQTPQLISFLNDRQALQCKQCGLRIPQEEGSQQKMDDHLDMHFMQNSRNDQSAGRGHSRSWFVAFENWMPECKSKAQNEKERAAAAAIEKETRLKDAYVVIPLGDEAKTIACPICKEVLNPEFMEEEEEWVYKNAVDVKGKIYHSTCHADASATPHALINRIKQHLEQRSRSGTPEVEPKREDTPALAPILKRKTREDDSLDSNHFHGIKREEGGTPPLKRVTTALAVAHLPNGNNFA